MHGDMLIAGARRHGAGAAFHGIDAATGAPLAPAFGSALPSDVDDACAAAAGAAATYAALPRSARAAFLDAVALGIEALGDRLIDRAMQETGLPRPRLAGERTRTVTQLRLFAEVVRHGAYLDRRLVAALPDRVPMPRPDLRLTNRPLGPVAVFGASNFPLAFSVAGGDTAAALAAGCPVVVKAHPAHPGTSELVATAVRDAAAATGMPEGVFGLLFDGGIEAGARLAADPRIRAIGFTGSRRAGLALVAIAQGRRVPIPVFAEMSSVNPVLLFPAALAARTAAIADGFVAALTGSVGQMCTAPGLVLAFDGPYLDRFLARAGEGVAAVPAATMLTAGIAAANAAGAAALAAHPGVKAIAAGAPAGPREGQARLFATDAGTLLDHAELGEEVFGPTALVVRCRDINDLAAVVDAAGGQLTISLHVDDGDLALAGRLMPLIEDRAGRILADGFGTGVEVSPAMVHGGPFPATSDGRSTSVGTLAIARFLRPVSYQNLPDALLPDDLRDSGPEAAGQA